ncbi:DJ-1 [Coniophora puteana RWD-64-598 SS2]|uniref:D-lactate dehydratase n=1 Tax=Coniophora puteana (strain RWD-64-598) TaxID=741705 RepID=A0A5M3MDB8_CONPW|nr:DJ-1 [Coniophora puteana RWD-64-598 SS2]EIW77218.1 DJ-1 [Coniophora puteana RWD-64-598 SS2]
MAKKVLILIADGTEEMEFTIAYDTLVRAGIECTSALVSASSSATHATCSRGVKIVPDTIFNPSESGPEKYDALIVPGGAQGAKTISETAAVQELVRAYHEKPGRIVGSLAALTSADGGDTIGEQELTSHPSIKDQLKEKFAYSDEPVVVSKSGKLITSRGPGTAFPFAFKLVELLAGAGKRDETIGPMVFPAGTPLKF